MKLLASPKGSKRIAANDVLKSSRRKLSESAILFRVVASGTSVGSDLWHRKMTSTTKQKGVSRYATSTRVTCHVKACQLIKIQFCLDFLRSSLFYLPHQTQREERLQTAKSKSDLYEAMCCAANFTFHYKRSV